MNAYLLGYDIRLTADAYVAQRWTGQHRETFLLRPETRWPVSVDSSVWPTVFRYTDQKSGFLGVPLAEEVQAAQPDFAHRVLDLWQDPEAMRHALKQSDAAPSLAGKTVEMAVTLSADASVADIRRWSGLFEDADAFRTRQPPAHWQFLGFDVADDAMTSGLSNCGFTEAEKPETQARFGGHLNYFGLFQRWTDADQFRMACNTRIPEHSPFYVFGIHRAL